LPVSLPITISNSGDCRPPKTEKQLPARASFEKSGERGERVSDCGRKSSTGIGAESDEPDGLVGFCRCCRKGSRRDRPAGFSPGHELHHLSLRQGEPQHFLAFPCPAALTDTNSSGVFPYGGPRPRSRIPARRANNRKRPSEPTSQNGQLGTFGRKGNHESGGPAAHRPGGNHRSPAHFVKTGHFRPG
jgi:hypothetical protein